MGAYVELKISNNKLNIEGASVYFKPLNKLFLF